MFLHCTTHRQLVAWLGNCSLFNYSRIPMKTTPVFETFQSICTTFQKWKTTPIAAGWSVINRVSCHMCLTQSSEKKKKKKKKSQMDSLTLQMITFSLNTWLTEFLRLQWWLHISARSVQQADVFPKDSSLGIIHLNLEKVQTVVTLTMKRCLNFSLWATIAAALHRQEWYDTIKGMYTLFCQYGAGCSSVCVCACTLP